MSHHSEYDSSTSQPKNYAIDEINGMRSRLYDDISHKLQHGSPDASRRAGRKEDERILSVLVDTMAVTQTIDWLRAANFAGWFFDWDRLEGVHRFLDRNGPEHEFIDPELEALRKELYPVCNDFARALGTETYPVGKGNRNAIPEDWETEQPARFREVVEKVHTLADRVCESYDRLVRKARTKLPS